MKLFTAEQIRRWDAATIDKGVPSIQLMERAVHALIPRILTLVTNRCRVIILAGPGNNGGDALALSRLLAERGFDAIQTYLIATDTLSLSPDCESNWKQSNGTIQIGEISDLPSAADFAQADLIVDGLFGSGLSRPLGGLYAECVQRVNASQSRVFAIDIPSGAMSDSYDEEALVMEADHVLTFQVPKRIFLIPESERFMKDFEVVDIHLDKTYHEEEPCDRHYLQKEDLIIPQRSRFAHKGTFGHGLLMAGSRGMYGAAQLSARAALRTGIGLLSIQAPSEAQDMLQGLVPEALFKPDAQVDHLTSLTELTSYDAIAIGPGIGMSKDTTGLIDALFDQAPEALILDADALNIIAKEDWVTRIPSGTILTPHPKEFSRLFGADEDSFAALDKQQMLAQEYGWILLRKGAYTSVALPDGRLYFNSTGNPYMASGGMGDVLTGMILSLRAQGLTSEMAALAAVFFHGQAGDTALSQVRGAHILASDVIEAIRIG